MRILWSVGTIVLALVSFGLAVTGLGMHGVSQGIGPRVARTIVLSAAIAIGVLELRPRAKGKFLLTVALGWTAVMALVVWW